MMKNILALANREVLDQFAWSNVLLAFDYDGTLAPIVDDPERAFMRPRTRALLEEAAVRYPTIVISGRAQADALSRLRGVRLHQVVGNHGLEPWNGTAVLQRQVKTWSALLRADLAGMKGVHLEDKTFSLAVHYRQSREKKKARAAIAHAVARLGPVRVVGGKQVVNVLPEGAPHKGVALERERVRLGCDTALYVGDDETDEDVFALEQPGLLTIRVGARNTSAATYFVPRQAAIDQLLTALIERRATPAARKRASR